MIYVTAQAKGRKKMNQTDRTGVLAFAQDTFGTEPEYLFRSSPQTAVLRHPNGKWYAILMPVAREKLIGSGGQGIADVINVKCDPLMTGSMWKQTGCFPAYHMNKNNWISILLDGTVPAETVFSALRTSYALVAEKTRPIRRKKGGNVQSEDVFEGA